MDSRAKGGRMTRKGWVVLRDMVLMGSLSAGISVPLFQHLTAHQIISFQRIYSSALEELSVI